MKPAQFARLGPVLIKECKILLVEFFEEISPVDRLEIFVARLKIKAKDARFIAGFCSLDGRRLAAAFFSPTLNFLVIDCRMTLGHRLSPRLSILFMSLIVT